jgi:hypothetical protein
VDVDLEFLLTVVFADKNFGELRPRLLLWCFIVALALLSEVYDRFGGWWSV